MLARYMDDHHDTDYLSRVKAFYRHCADNDLAVAVAERAYEEDLAALPRPADLRAHLEAMVYDPRY